MNKFNPTKYKNEYNKDNYDRVNLTIPKGTKEELKEIAKYFDLSLNAYLKIIIEENILLNREEQFNRIDKIIKSADDSNNKLKIAKNITTKNTNTENA